MVCQKISWAERKFGKGRKHRITRVQTLDHLRRSACVQMDFLAKWSSSAMRFTPQTASVLGSRWSSDGKRMKTNCVLLGRGLVSAKICVHKKNRPRWTGSWPISQDSQLNGLALRDLLQREARCRSPTFGDR